jgi:FkbM family methyltransferase
MNMTNQELLESIITSLPSLRGYHTRESDVYKFLNVIALQCIGSLFGESGPQVANLGEAGEINFPYVSMGSINSTHLFGLDELIIFAFYSRNRRNYKRVADIGANIGLHSTFLAKLGFEVQCYEPDPLHLDLLKHNLKINGMTHRVTIHNKAVSTEVDSLEFIRVLGNTTGSHLAGAKKDPYGDLERFTVETASFREILQNVDLVKLDVEGHELEILISTTNSDWKQTDAIIEVGTPENAHGVFRHLQEIGVGMFSQKNSWRRVSQLDQVPTSHREGSLFISTRAEMNWA